MRKTVQSKNCSEIPPLPPFLRLLTKEEVLMYIHLILYFAIRNHSDEQLDALDFPVKMRNPYGFNFDKVQFFVMLNVRDSHARALEKITNCSGTIDHIEFIKRTPEEELGSFREAPFGRVNLASSNDELEETIKRLPYDKSCNLANIFFDEDAGLGFLVGMIQLGCIDLYGLTTNGRKS